MKKFCFFYLLFIFCLGILNADITHFFKKTTGKDALYYHQMSNIDFIYTLNLDQRPEKFAHCQAELAPYGIHPYRFSAVNGWELSLKDINTLGVKYESGMVTDLWGTYYSTDGDFEPHHEVMHMVGRNYFCHCMSRGAIGIVLSHLSILQDAYDSGYETIWVMEDDIQVIQNPHRISSLISKLDKEVGTHNWDILFTDQDTKNQQGNYVPCLSFARKPNYNPTNIRRFSTRTNEGKEFRKIGARYGAYSMIVRRSGMKKILNYFKMSQIFLPYDMEFYLPNDIVMYAVTHDIVSTLPHAISDNGGANYKSKSTE